MVSDENLRPNTKTNTSTWSERALLNLCSNALPPLSSTFYHSAEHWLNERRNIYIREVSYTVAFLLILEIKSRCSLHLTQRLIFAVWSILKNILLGTGRRSRHVLRHHDLFHADHDHDFYLFHAELTKIMVRGLLIMVRGLHNVTWYNLFHGATILPVYVVLDPFDNLCLQIWTGPLKMPNLDHMMLDLQTQFRLIFLE